MRICCVRVWLGVIAALLCSVFDAYAAPSYRLVDLAGFQPDDINEQGQVAGVMPPRFGSPVAGLLQPGATAPTSIAFGTGLWDGVRLNNYGQILSKSPGILSGALSQPFWTPDLPNGASGAISQAMYPPGPSGNLEGPIGPDIGEDGTILVNGWDFVGGGRQSYIWKPSTPNGATGSMTLFGGGGGTNVVLNSINERGDIAGVDAKGAFVFIPTVPNGLAGVRYPLSATPMGLASSAAEINDVGQVAGDTVVGNRRHAMFWNPQVPNGSTGVMSDLGLLPGRLQSRAVDVNNAGMVVGVADDDSATSSSSANLINGLSFLWTSSGGMQNLGDLLDSTGAGWQLYGVRGINDRGQIVGIGSYDPDGPGGVPLEVRGFLLNPVPEPTTLALVCSGFACCLAARRRQRR
ncbi:PEP-CTERM sorting domain-containing protein [Lacipirellula parvula]|uniref:Ice-binding protein C-terminal domain-containing protein n=1 Tax=Lacipirellula parvula TaxID=2650471 RepID=A0A5K7XMV7_9BACT|nr:PEP-CTERM sorting domain-containing protein [Lacipirellula parvula]BBO36246.1 hypothetical protein PLANPX_5858 [Lacipirellula parvula]